MLANIITSDEVSMAAQGRVSAHYRQQRWVEAVFL